MVELSKVISDDDDDGDEYDCDEPILSLDDMEMVSLKKGITDYETARAVKEDSSSSFSSLTGLFRSKCNQITMIICMIQEVYPIWFWSLAIGVSAIVFYFGAVVLISTQAQILHRNEMERDYSDLTLQYDFKNAKIDHYCLYGADHQCSCHDPTESISREDSPHWVTAYDRNKKLVRHRLHNDPASDSIDVVFLGDDLVAPFSGSMYGNPSSDVLNDVKMDTDFVMCGIKSKKRASFDQYVNETFGSGEYGGGLIQSGNVNGLALGIPGDGATNLMWRLQHGEIPSALKPKVWWIMIGTNDLASMGCSEEVVTLGILRVAEEIAHRYPSSTVVIQGLLPRSFHKDGRLVGAPNKKQGGAKEGSSTSTDGGATTSISDTSDHLNKRVHTDDPHHPHTDGGHHMLAKEGHSHMDKEKGDDQRQLHQKDQAKQNVQEGKKEFKRVSAEDLKKRQKDYMKNGGHKEPAVSKTLTESLSIMSTLLTDPMRFYGPTKKYVRNLWPSIQTINRELEMFCEKHDHFVYYDASELFLGTVGNEHYQQTSKQIIPNLMPDYMSLSALGYQVLGDHIVRELKKIILNKDETNDFEQRDKLIKNETNNDTEHKDNHDHHEHDG